ncbi:helix-turn-helix domain-containing protein [Actinoplanes sp. HUAS TT8]|uniref:AraC-like ligand-binding domain-containing protein n=1 Tax=Actinoplanes sp. HUAS TT8 TaxID=3447453 RepID=UPI003F5243DB
MRTIFDSSAIPVPDRLEAFRSMVDTWTISTEIYSPQASAFTARFGAMSLGTVQVTALSYTSLKSSRPARLIRRSDPEYYQVGFIHAGGQGIDQHDRRAVLRPGDLVIYDSSHPFEASAIGETSPAESVVLHFPRHLLPLPGAQVARLCARPLPGTSGLGGLLRQFVGTLIEQHDRQPQPTERDLCRLGDITIDLATAVMAHHLDQRHPPLHSPSRVLYLRVLSYIEQNLQRPGLGPAGVADAHRISLRYLHRIFQQHHGSTVNAHIRTRRLEGARRDLIDPRLGHRTIASIAARWGFPRPADFTRAFQKHTGRTPRDYRHPPPDPAAGPAASN